MCPHNTRNAPFDTTVPGARRCRRATHIISVLCNNNSAARLRGGGGGGSSGGGPCAPPARRGWRRADPGEASLHEADPGGVLRLCAGGTPSDGGTRVERPRGYGPRPRGEQTYARRDPYRGRRRPPRVQGTRPGQPVLAIWVRAGAGALKSAQPSNGSVQEWTPVAAPCVGAGSCVKLLARRARDFTFRMYALCPGMDPKGVTNQATQNTMTPGPLLTKRETHRERRRSPQ